MGPAGARFNCCLLAPTWMGQGLCWIRAITRGTFVSATSINWKRDPNPAWVLLTWPLRAGGWELGRRRRDVRLQDPTHVFQCPPCRSLTRVLVESYRKIKEAGQKFEIIFVSADR